MNFNCPYCKKKLNLMELQAESDLMAIIRMQPAFGKYSNLVWAYIELFGITPMKAKTKKIRILLEEIKSLFDSEKFSYSKKDYSISTAGIAEALNTTVKRNFETALTNHNYLKSIMVTISERESRGASIQEERDLRKKEERAMNAYRETDEVSRRDPNGAAKVGDILKKLGGVSA